MRESAIAMAGLLILAAAVRSDLSCGEIGFGPGRSMDPVEALKALGAGKAPAARGIIPAGYVVGNDPQVGKPGVPVEWVSISGGKFMMGTDNGDSDAKPVHEVAIKTFEMSKTLVTVEQYAECVIKGRCTEPGSGDRCNWGKAGRRLYHPVNCVDWEQADQYAKFKGARLPSESEWEYAATSGGRNQKYPWGNEYATCERAVMIDDDGHDYGCGHGGTLPVCSRPAGNTAQGLCDMAGNVLQWVQDRYRFSYNYAPTDGSAFEASDFQRVVRGGSFRSGARNLRADRRFFGPGPGYREDSIGFRLARSSR